MKKLSEVEAREFRGGRRFPSSKLFDTIADMDTGEALLVEKKDWPGKARLSDVLSRMAARKGSSPRQVEFQSKKFKVSTGEKGWKVVRVR